MDHETDARLKALVTDFRLEEALDLLIARSQHETQRKQNTLLVLKGKLSMLEEQCLNGILSPDEMARQKAAIAHQILDIADGSTLDEELPAAPPQGQILVQKTVTAPSAGNPSFGKYLLLAALLLGAVLAGIVITKSLGGKKSAAAGEPKPAQPRSEETASAGEIQPASPSDGPMKVLDFPNLKQPFNFLDFGVEFAWVEAERISDSEIRLKMRCYLTCKSNQGICYCPTVRIYADGQPVQAAEQSHKAAWVAQDATATNDLRFVLPADARTFHIELSRDLSTWKRPFKILP